MQSRCSCTRVKVYFDTVPMVPQSCPPPGQEVWRNAAALGRDERGRVFTAICNMLEQCELMTATVVCIIIVLVAAVAVVSKCQV